MQKCNVIDGNDLLRLVTLIVNINADYRLLYSSRTVTRMQERMETCNQTGGGVMSIEEGFERGCFLNREDGRDYSIPISSQATFTESLPLHSFSPVYTSYSRIFQFFQTYKFDAIILITFTYLNKNIQLGKCGLSRRGRTTILQIPPDQALL